MTGILFLRGISYCNQFKCNYVKSKIICLYFLVKFQNLHQILKITKKKMTLIADVFSKLQIA